MTLRDISAQKRKPRESCDKYHDHLEDLVKRSAPPTLAKSNAAMSRKSKSAKRAERNPCEKREVELKAQSHHLAEVNTAFERCC